MNKWTYENSIVIKRQEICIQVNTSLFNLDRKQKNKLPVEENRK